MEVTQQLLGGFVAALSPLNLLMAVLGAIFGTFVGVLPGLGPTAAIALLFPLTTVLAPAPAIIMLAGIYYGAMYGGSTTAILLNIPGEIASVPTCLDGYPLVMKGVNVHWWAGIALASAVPDAIVRKWEATLAEMVKDPEFLAKADRISMNIDYLSAAELRAFVEKEATFYTELAGRIGIRR